MAMKGRAEFYVNTYGGPDVWSWETLVSVGDDGEGVQRLSDSINTYPTEEEAFVAGEKHLAQSLHDVIVNSIAAMHR